MVVGIPGTFQVAAHPNEVPDIVHLVQAEIGAGNRVVEVKVSNEDLRRDRLDATYCGEFGASLALPVAFFHEVGRGEGYVLVDKVFESGKASAAHGFGSPWFWQTMLQHPVAFRT